MLIASLADLEKLDPQQQGWAYNVLDCCVTADVEEAVEPRLDADQRFIYAFERAMQSPAFTMMRRGILINGASRGLSIDIARRELTKQVRAINKVPLVKDFWDKTTLVTGVCPAHEGKHHKWPRGVPDSERSCLECGQSRTVLKPFNPNSNGPNGDVWHLLYTRIGIKPLRNKKRDLSVDDDVLEKIARLWAGLRELDAGMRERVLEGKVLIDAIRAARGQKKQIGFLKAPLSADMRYHSSFNVGAPETGRWSASKDPFREGGNCQNIAEKHRHIFIADPGMTMYYADLEQAESRCVAYDAEDEAYIQAHLTGDVHTAVARMLWPELPWTGDLPKDKKIAGASCDFDPDHSWRYNAKRCQHGLNYGLSPNGLAMLEHIPQKAARAVYQRYFEMFPYVYKWQKKMAWDVSNIGIITSVLRRKRQFFGRRWDAHTVRQAIAYVPQGMVADILNAALWKVWHDFDPVRTWLLANVHDAILGEFWDEDVDFPALLIKAMEIPVKMRGGRMMTIPVEVKVGKNWGVRDMEGKANGIPNKRGMVKWTPGFREFAK